jgi:hypothetical protein
MFNFSLENVQNFDIDQTDDHELTISIAHCDSDGRDHVSTITLASGNFDSPPEVYVNGEQVSVGLDPTSEIKIGDEVRSFDFEDRSLDGPRACYVVGVVEDVVNMEGCPRYQIRATRRVFGGNEQPIDSENEFVYPPVNGTPTSMGGICTFVDRI